MVLRAAAKLLCINIFLTLFAILRALSLKSMVRVTISCRDSAGTDDAINGSSHRATLCSVSQINRFSETWKALSSSSAKRPRVVCGRYPPPFPSPTRGEGTCRCRLRTRSVVRELRKLPRRISSSKGEVMEALPHGEARDDEVHTRLAETAPRHRSSARRAFGQAHHDRA